MKKLYKNLYALSRLSRVTLIVALFCSMQVFAQTPVVLNGTHVAYNTSTHTITSFYYTAGVSPADIIIPRAIEVSTGVFDVIKNIGSNAFAGCGLNSVAFEASSEITTLGSSAFQGNPLAGGIVLPGTVTSLGASAFQACASLPTIDLSHLTLTTLPTYCFANCSGLTTALLPDGLITINSQAFYVCNSLNHIVIPPSVTTINGEYTFYDVAEGCIIDMSTKQPGYYPNTSWFAFKATLLWHPDGEDNTSDFIFNKTTGKIYGLKHSYSGSGNIVIPDKIDGITVTGLGDGAFGSRPSNQLIRTITFEMPRTAPITEIPIFAFAAAGNLTAITLPNDITIIARDAFRSCTRLASINSYTNRFPASLKSIGNRAFDGSRLDSITLPAGFETIDVSAFLSNTRLKKVTFLGDQITTLANNTFNGCSALTHIYITEMDQGSVANAPWGANYAWVHWRDANDPPLTCRDDSGEWDFMPLEGTIIKYYGATGSDVDLVIPNSLSCDGTPFPILYVGVPSSSVTGNRLFESSVYLNSVTVSDGIKEIRQYTFYGNNIKTVDFGNTVQKILANAFQNCSIGSLTLPESLDTITSNVFNNCALIGEIVIPGNVKNIDVTTFQNNPGITQFLIKQYRNKTSDPEGYNPDGTPPTYIKSPANVQGRAPFGAVNAASRVYYMDDPMPVFSNLVITPHPATNSLTINVRVIMDPTTMVIDTVKAANSTMPDVDIIVKPTMTTVHWQVKMEIDSLHGNGNYVFEAFFNNSENSRLLNVMIDHYHNVTYNGNGHTAGTVPALSHYIQDANVVVLSPSAGFAKTCYIFKGWATTATAITPTYTWNGTNFTPASFAMGATDIALYAVWEDNRATAADITVNDANICAGATAALSASSSTITTPTFRWYASQTATSYLAQGANYTTNALSTDTAFYVSVFGGGVCENVVNTRKRVIVTIKAATAIGTHPSTTAPTAMCYNTGNFPQLSVTATGAGLTYQWYSNTTASTTGATTITGATSATYTPTSNLTAGDYYYYCVVTGDCGALTSGFSGVHTIRAATAITTHPATTAPETMCYNTGNFPQLSVSATGANLTYQWYSNTSASTTGATLLTGATSATYTPTSNITAGDYYYYCVVTGTCGTQTSNFSGVHTVEICKFIDCDDEAKTATEDACEIGYYTHPDNSWNIVPIEGFTFDNVKYIINGTLAGATLNGVQFAAGATHHVVAVAYMGLLTDTCRFDVTVAALGPKPTLTSATTIPAICSGGEVNYEATTSTTQTATDFLWVRTPVPGILPAIEGRDVVANIQETLSNTTSSPITVTYHFYLTHNGCNNTQDVTVTVNPLLLPTITVTGTLSVCVGERVTYNSTITHGGSNPTRQWMVNGEPVAGATTPTFTYVPQHGDVITCMLTSSATCVDPVSVTSSGVTMTVIEYPAAPTLLIDTLRAFKGMPVDLSQAVDMLPDFTYTFYANPNGTGRLNSSVVIFNPPKNDYYVTATFSGCEGSATMIILVDPCPETVSDEENNVYRVTSLAGLCWTENLKSTLYPGSGEPIAFANPYTCAGCPEQLEDIFGLLYTWYSAVGVPERAPVVQGICPNGWHIPSKAEWSLLSSYPAGKLKCTQYWTNPPGPGTDDFGFDARPGGWYNSIANRYQDLYGFTGWWASDVLSENERNTTTANYFYITYYCDRLENALKNKSDGLSVRCVKD